RSISIQSRTDDWQRCVATVNLGIQIKQHRILSFPGAAICTRTQRRQQCRCVGDSVPAGIHSGSPAPQRLQMRGKRSEKAIESCVTYMDTSSQSFSGERVTTISRLV